MKLDLNTLLYFLPFLFHSNFDRRHHFKVGITMWNFRILKFQVAITTMLSFYCDDVHVSWYNGGIIARFFPYAVSWIECPITEIEMTEFLIEKKKTLYFIDKICHRYVLGQRCLWGCEKFTQNYVVFLIFEILIILMVRAKWYNFSIYF